MKVVTWKELFEIEGDVVWGYYSEDNFPRQVYIQYNEDLRNNSENYKRVCEEEFPILKPDYNDAFNYWDALDKFNISLEGEVSKLETGGDVYNRESEDTKVVIYDQDDINNWKDKLNSLVIKY